MLNDEIQLLRDYAATRSQPAFARLAERYVDLVYSAARRQCRGDAHLAEDVTQAVFIILADKAATVPADRPLSAWLLKTCSYCAANARRSKTHREQYERRAAQMARMNEPSAADQSAWDELAPMLDEGMNKLRPQDRDALLLKFFEKKSMRQIGEALGISEEAAGKRVARAVDRLRDFFRRRGAVVSAAALPVLLMSNAAQAAPAALMSAVVATTTTGAAAAATATVTATGATATTAAATSSSAAAAVAKGALAVMAAEKAKAIALAAAAIILGVGGSVVAVKTFLAPVTRGNRQVAIAPQPAATATTRGVRNAWPVRFQDGTLVEVLGICEQSANGAAGAQWWTLDGSAVPTPDAFTPNVKIPLAPRSRAIQILLRFDNIAPNTGRVVILRPNLSGATTATRTVPPGAPGEVMNGVTHYVTLVPENQKTADLVLGIGSGVWETIATYDVKDLRSSLPSASPRITKLAQEGASLVVEATLPRGDVAAAAAARSPLRDEQLVVITDSGERREPINRSTFNGVVRHRFPIELARVQRLEWRSRPFATVHLANVSLRPAEITKVHVTGTSRAVSPGSADAR